MSLISFDSHFKDLFNNTNDLIHFVKEDGTIELVNPAWLKTLGYQSEEVLGKSIYDFIDPFYKEKYIKVRETLLESNGNIDIETTFLTRSGNQVILEGQIGCTEYSGNLLYTRAVLKNITVRKSAEKIVAESEKRINTLFKRGPDAIIIIDEHQQILEWNPKATEIFGFTEVEVKGKLLSELIIPIQYREAHKRGMSHFLKTGTGPVLNKTIEISALNKSGEEFFINLSISNVRIENGWLFIAFISDITERKKTEESLIKKEAELLRTKLLEEKRDEFISIASHELKTPLTTIKAYTQLAIVYGDQNNSDKVKEFLLKTDRHIDKLNRLISELLDVSKIHAGKLSLNLEKIHFDKFLSIAVENIQSTLLDHVVTIKRNDHCYIEGDIMRLEQVIVNLLTNASKYSPGKRDIFINSIIEDHFVIVSIQDFGIGIPKDHQEKVFTRFYRVEESGTHYNGLGIGLFICAEILKQHDGYIWNDSEENKGSTFFIKIPLVSN